MVLKTYDERPDAVRFRNVHVFMRPISAWATRRVRDWSGSRRSTRTWLREVLSGKPLLMGRLLGANGPLDRLSGGCCFCLPGLGGLPDDRIAAHADKGHSARAGNLR